MKKVFVETKNWEALQNAVTRTEKRGSPEASLILVTGEPGMSKTTTMLKYVASSRATYLRALTTWTPTHLIGALCHSFCVQHPIARDRFNNLISALISHNRPIIIDELDLVLDRGPRLLELIRDISDSSEQIIILVGMETILQRISRYKQIASRVSAHVQFKPLDIEDTAALCKGLCDLTIAPDLVAEIHRQAAGSARLVTNAIAVVENLGKRNGMDAVNLSAMRGQVLCADWQRRKSLGSAA